MDSGRVRLRLHWGGAFQYLQSGSWGYIGGEVFNEHVDSSCQYADLCCKINDKVGYTTSIKYLCPGEEMSPHELISITGEDDLQELYEEYFLALQRPGTPVKTFRVKLFLFPALQDEWDADAKPVHQPFNPDEWYDGNDDEIDEAAELWLGEQQRSSELMVWERTQQERQDLPSHFVPAFHDRPPEESTGGGLFGVRFDVAVEQQLERHAMGNLKFSVSRSRRLGITEEIGLPDPYHETDTSMGSAILKHHSRGPPHLKEDAAHGVAGGETTAHIIRVLGSFVDPKMSPGGGANGYSSLAGNFPSHISIFGKDEVPTGGGGRALSAGADESGGGAEFSPSGGNALDKSGAAFLESPGGDSAAGIHLPSHISIFGSNSGDDAEDMGEQARLKAMDEAAAAAGMLHTQDFVDKPKAVENVRLPPFAGPPFLNGICRLGDAVHLDLNAGAEHEEDGMTREPATPAVQTPKLLEEVVRVPTHEVHIIRKIGEGAFGEVSYANVESHGLVAVKWLKRDRFAKYSESFMREAEVLAKLNHPNIIRMYGVVIEQSGPGASMGGSSGGGESGGSRDNTVGTRQVSAPDQPVIIAGIMTDFVRGGSLSGQLRAAKRRPTLKERCQVAVQACRGMAFLHAQNPAIIHFDLKPDNLLVDGDGENLHVKVADFGLSKHKFQTFVSCRDLRGTLPYMAPELVSNPNQVSERCDVWSMGVVMWEMYTLEVPYNDMTAQQILAALMDGSIHLHIPSACEPEWRGLIEMCMDTNPEARPSFRQVVSHLDAMLRQMGC